MKHRPVFALGPGQRWFAIFCRQIGIHRGKGDLLIINELWQFIDVANREWFSPIPLSAENGIAQAERHFSPAFAGLFEQLDGGRDAIEGSHSIERLGIFQNGRLV